MHQPTRISFEGDEQLAASFVAEAHVHLRKVTSVAQAAGVGMFAKTALLDNGVVVYAMYTATQSIIHITAPYTSNPSEQTVPTSRRRPDFYSGIARGGKIEARDVVPPKVDDGWDYGEPPKSGVRFDMDSFKPTPRWMAQVNVAAAKAKAAGAKAVDIVHLSPGYQPVTRLAVDPPKWYDVFPQPDERTVPAQYMKITPSCYSGQMKKLAQYVLGLGRLTEEELATDDPLTEEVKAHGFTIRYDFRWASTHGLVKAADKRWWLVEISQARGVLAMPLPLYEDLPDAADSEPPEIEELKDVVAEFGGQPTGQSFPTGKELTKAIERGDVLQLLTVADIAAFYGYSPYSTCFGWAFSSDGHEAHNTAHTIETYTDGMDVGVGVHYSIRFSIGAINTHRQENDPIATATASIVRISRGYLDRPGKKVGVQFHSPEPMLEDGAMATYEFPLRTRRVRCDTTMHVFFIGKSLQLVRYYQDPKSMPAHIDGVRPAGCGELNGSYAWTEYGSGGNVPAQFYTNQYDFREKLAASMASHTYSAVPGAFSGPLINDWLNDVRHATINRVRAIKIRTTSFYDSGIFMNVHIACPYGAREAYVIYKYRSTLSSWSTKTTQSQSMGDPNSGTTFRYFYHKKPDGDNSCYEESVRRIISLETNRVGCNYIADAGQWLSTCQAIYSSPRAGGGADSSTGTTPKATYACESYLVANTEFQNYTLKVTTGDQARWETKSPDEFGMVKHFDCVFSALGAQHAVFNQRISTAPLADDYVQFGSLHKPGDAGFFSYLGVL